MQEPIWKDNMGIGNRNVNSYDFRLHSFAVLTFSSYFARHSLMSFVFFTRLVLVPYYRLFTVYFFSHCLYRPLRYIFLTNSMF